MPVLCENKCVSTRFELSIRCIEAERERFPKEYICTKMLTAPIPSIHFSPRYLFTKSKVIRQPISI